MKSFSTVVRVGAIPTIIPILKALYPPLRFLVRISIPLQRIFASNLPLDYSQHQMTLLM